MSFNKIEKSALIGFTGFVGSNLAQQSTFTDFFNTKNSSEMNGKSYDLVICAGVSAVKWWANQNPEEDLQKIVQLLDNLKCLQAKKFVLISTVDVYPVPCQVNESSSIDEQGHHAYGKNRLFLEREVMRLFNDVNIIRLPGLFGNGLKKNVIFDLIHSNNIKSIDPNGSFQYYFLDHMWDDIQIAINNNVKLLNICSEPIKTQEIADAFFANVPLVKKTVPSAQYNMQTQYAALWNKTGKHQYSKQDVLQQLGVFLSRIKEKSL